MAEGKLFFFLMKTHRQAWCGIWLGHHPLLLIHNSPPSLCRDGTVGYGGQTFAPKLCLLNSKCFLIVMLLLFRNN